MLGKSKSWSMSHLSHRPSEPAYYIKDTRILGPSQHASCFAKSEYSLSTGFRSTPAAHSDLSSRIYPSYDYMDNDFSAEAFKRNYNAKEFIKKSLADQKSLRFHQCYFNPISCFRR